MMCKCEFEDGKVKTACGAHAEYTRRELAYAFRNAAKRSRDFGDKATPQRLEEIAENYYPKHRL